jgi:hypothetical protein
MARSRSSTEQVPQPAARARRSQRRAREYHVLRLHSLPRFAEILPLDDLEVTTGLGVTTGRRFAVRLADASADMGIVSCRLPAASLGANAL